MKNIILTCTMVFMLSALSYGQMLGTLSVPSLGGATNANAATYSGDGVFVGVASLHSKHMNFMAVSVLWNTGVDILGAKYSVMISQPRIMDGNYQNGFFPVTFFVPLQLSWDLGTTKLQASYSYLYGQKLPLDAHFANLKATQYLADGKWSLNGGIIYEHRVARKEAERQLGDAVVFEGNVSRHFKNGASIGAFGYYNTNASPEYISGRSLMNGMSTTAGVGIDGNYPVGKHIFLSGKLIYDLQSNPATRCNKIVLGIAYKF
ncbi:hypothetical protein [Flammeovirga kamogawensis]|uniref:Transporter n=1 Tax=Flammeovirga kamogawensis TaxID=373891 RepID=A0ABX8GT01_9BACT|nr:hypothetical protein [Flammeovirga kamogawensis]MBB6462701.1 hypothetical protein [Flammeovirga kamogawensis]QWG06065.1 hypothetical protein KM029_11900 [Flammeovirga kamogawensis]TRX67897.1 hypothetical protein EO216_06925 [Flammeovirga kamogawensis]